MLQENIEGKGKFHELRKKFYKKDKEGLKNKIIFMEVLQQA